jgi:hypothetical protein
MNTIKKITIFSAFIILSGCSSLKDKNPNIEYEKTASLICDGNYQVFNNGNVTNEKLTVFKNHLKNEPFENLHEVAQNNFINLTQCLDIAKKYSIKHDIISDTLTNVEALKLRKIFLNNYNEIKKELTEDLPEESKQTNKNAVT